MKKAFLVLMMMAVCGNAYSAELLVQAKPHWMDSLTEKEVLAMDESTRQNYEARTKIGDVIAVRPDGWAWGKEEGLPNYVVVKVPMTVEEAQKYEEQLVENVQYETVIDGKTEIQTTQVLKRRRKYAIPDAYVLTAKTSQILKRKRKYAIPDVYVSTAKTSEQTDVSIASKDVTAFKSAIIEKVGLSAEVKPPVKDTIKTDLQSFYKKHLQKYVAVARTFWIENAWAATQLKKTVCPSGCDYTALETCMNANEQNLVTADKYFDVEISGTWSSADTTAVTIHNYTTDSTRYINIYTTGNARHAGVYSTSKYRMYVKNGCISISGDNTYLTIDGLIINVYAEEDYTWVGSGISSTAIPQITIKNNVIKRTGSTLGAVSSGSGISWGGATYGGVLKAYNNIIYSFAKNGTAHDGLGIAFSQYNGTGYIYNNTIYNCDKGINQGNTSTGYTKNNIVQSSSNYDYSLEDAGSNNLDDDGTGDITATLDFVSKTAGSEDFHLAASDTAAIDAGADLSGTFTTDIDGTTRSGTWDIGADEYVATRRRMMLIQ